MTDWTRVHAFAKHTFIESFPISSFLLAGVSFYKETIKSISIGDILSINFEANQYDSSAIVIKKELNICGYVPRDLKEKIKMFVPGQVKVIDKRLVEDNIYSLRVDIQSS